MSFDVPVASQLAHAANKYTSDTCNVLTEAWSKGLTSELPDVIRAAYLSGASQAVSFIITQDGEEEASPSKVHEAIMNVASMLNYDVSSSPEDQED